MAAGAYALDPVGPTWLEGSCPVKEQNKESLDLYKMAGLWFEYLWEDHMATDMEYYVCSSFIWLDEGNGEYVVYNSFQFPADVELKALERRQRAKKGLPIFTEAEIEQQKLDKENGVEPETFKLGDIERESTFIAYKLFWEDKEEGGNQRARAAFDRDLEVGTEIDPNQTGNWNKTIQVIDTDYHSYQVSLLCEERENPDTGATEHSEDYFVLTREKQPSMYMRKRARDALLKDGVSEERLNLMNKGMGFDCWGKDHHY